MGVGGVKAVESISGSQMVEAKSMDSKSKSIENEIANVQRQKQELSSKKDISVEEKAKRRQELQQEISHLNVQLRQRQAEVRKEQQKKLSTGKLRAENTDTKDDKDKDSKIEKTKKTASNKKAADKEIFDKKNSENKALKEAASKNIDKEPDKGIKETGNTEPEDKNTQIKETGISPTEIQKLVSADFSMKQMELQERVIFKMEGGVVILKGEISQDEARGEDVELKKAELEKQENKVQQASTASLSSLDKGYRILEETMQAAQVQIF